MRRNKQALCQEECEQVLRRATSGVLSLISPDGFPYGVPLSYALVDGVIVFHGALEGQKIDCIRRDNRASFCVVDADDVVPEKYTTAYRSVIVRGANRHRDGRKAEARSLHRAGEALLFG